MTALDGQQAFFIKGLIHVLTVPLEEGVTHLDRARTIFEAYEACINVGAKDKADVAINAILGPPAGRAKFGVQHAPEIPPGIPGEPEAKPRCTCGHDFEMHGIGTYCHFETNNELACVCKEYKAFVTQVPVAQAPLPTGTCTCGHAVGTHDELGTCSLCACEAYSQDERWSDD